MNYTDAQKEQLKKHLESIVAYIEDEILPHITYNYQTPCHGERLNIEINGCYENKIRLCSRGRERTLDDLIFFEYATDFLKHWQEFKSDFLAEIEHQNEINALINNFTI